MPDLLEIRFGYDHKLNHESYLQATGAVCVIEVQQVKFKPSAASNQIESRQTEEDVICGFEGVTVFAESVQKVQSD